MKKPLVNAAKLLQEMGFVVINRPREACPYCGWDLRKTPNGHICDVCWRY